MNKVDYAHTVGPQEWRARETADAAAGCVCALFRVFITVIGVWQVHILLWKHSGEFFSNIFESKFVQSIEETHGYQGQTYSGRCPGPVLELTWILSK